jgi:hypothetical protein
MSASNDKDTARVAWAERPGAVLGWAIVAVLIICTGYGAGVHFLSDAEGRGTFGDMFGGLNTAFAGLAFAGIVLAILMQRRELELQRQELELQRQEMRGQREEQALQVLALSLNARAALISAEAQQYLRGDSLQGALLRGEEDPTDLLVALIEVYRKRARSLLP